MEYYFNELDSRGFQRLINTILVTRLGEDARITPLIGKDGGRDSETASDNPYINFEVKKSSPRKLGSWLSPVRPGKYVFQSKFHRTTDARLSDVRSRVISEFVTELRENIIPKHRRDRITYFFLVTNVPGSGDAIGRVDEIRRQELQAIDGLHADVWWQDQVVAHLDLLPAVWKSFSSLFPGGKVPLLADIATDPVRGLSRSVRLAIHNQFQRDKIVKFRQIDLARELSKLFVDLDVDPQRSHPGIRTLDLVQELIFDSAEPVGSYAYNTSAHRLSALGVLLDESNKDLKKIILEGGPGQGKSTLTQMAAQVYRQKLLGLHDIASEERWKEPQKMRLPLRIELRHYAEQLGRDPRISIEGYIAEYLTTDAGGAKIEVSAVHDLVENSPVLLILDGLDEVGNDELRDLALERITEATERLENVLNVDLRVVLTSRPPAIAGTQGRLPHYARIALAVLNPDRVNKYLERWVNVQLHDQKERTRVRSSFESRRSEPHVEALIKNPMQLSVLLHFIYLKDDAFPSRRADLYQEYFKIVIDRDVEKSQDLRRQREIVESLHRFLGLRIHTLMEAQISDGSLTRADLLRHVGGWLEERGDDKGKALQLFKLGEERLGLIATLKGEGTSAKYGFEVQPIREYFAAAFINQDFEMNAHDLFEKMVRRPYWREVALFLAGLRRENEKADLVVRARQLDANPELGWRQDGRDILLQLAKEGSLSQPRHVLSDSLDFIMDLLDPEAVPVQNEPKDLTSALAKLLSTEGQESHRNRIRALLDRYMVCNDRGVVDRIFKVAGQILAQDEFKNYMSVFSSDFPGLMSFVRIRIPLEVGVRVASAKDDERLWSGIPDWILARELWLAAVDFPAATVLRVPEQVHAYLVERFAFGEFGRGRAYRGYPLPGNWAAWRLLEVEGIVASILDHLHRRSPERIEDMERFLNLPVNYSGLSAELESAARTLIHSTQELLSSCLKRKGALAAEDVGLFIMEVRSLLDEPGVVGWLGARVLALFLATDLRVGTPSRIGPLILDKHSEEALKKMASLWHAGRRSRHSAISGPRAIRFEKKGPAIPLGQLLAELLLHDREQLYGWLRRMPLSMEHIRPLIEICPNIDTQLLERLSSLEFRTPYAPYKPLRTSHLQRILAVARRSDNERVISGAIVAVAGSRFIRISGPKLLLKFLANRRRGRIIAGLVFRNPAQVVDHEQLALVQNLARSIMDNPRDFEKYVVLAATAFWGDHAKNNLPALASADGSLSLL